MTRKYENKFGNFWKPFSNFRNTWASNGIGNEASIYNPPTHAQSACVQEAPTKTRSIFKTYPPELGNLGRDFSGPREK